MTKSPSPSVDEVVLLPCPFCGAPGRVFDSEHPYRGGICWVAECSADCDMSASCAKRTKAEAAETWNRRASLVSPPKAGAPDAWQHRLFYEDTGKWSEWRPGKFEMLVANRHEERPLYANHEARGDGVMVTDEMVERACDEFEGEALGPQHGAVLKRMRRALEAALPPLGDGRAEIVRPTFADLRAAIEQSRNRNVAGGGWCLTDKQADTALEWAAFLEGIGAPCPKIAGFDEGLQLVWPGSAGRHYLSLDDATDGAFVLNVDAKGRRAPLSLEQGEKP